MHSVAATNCECTKRAPAASRGLKTKKFVWPWLAARAVGEKKRGHVHENVPSSEAAINCDCTLFGPAVDPSRLRTGLSEPGLITACWPPVHRCVDGDLHRQHDALQARRSSCRAHGPTGLEKAIRAQSPNFSAHRPRAEARRERNTAPELVIHAGSQLRGARRHRLVALRAGGGCGGEHLDTGHGKTHFSC